MAAKLPSVPFDLTDKNKALLRQFDSERLQAKLVFLPEDFLSDVTAALETGLVRFVDAQVAIAVDILLIAPLRPQNLARLNWRRHFSEPNGPRGLLRLHIPAEETKGRKRELIFDLPPDVARRLRWYRRHIMPRLDADPDGDLFVKRAGVPKTHETITVQITDRIKKRLGNHMTPHQFRHLAAKFYLDEHPEDFETIRALLGHAFSKTTRIYAGASSRRASRAYNTFVTEQRDGLKAKRKPQRRR